MIKYNTIFRFIVLIMTGFVLQSGGCQKDDPSSDNPILGTPGPANGIIFFDKGMYTDGWRYMEIMPFNANTPNTAAWGCANILLNGCGGEDIGTGLQNTQDILQGQMTNSCGSNSNAALFCDNYTISGYSDWFLPSKLELDKALELFKQKNIGSIGPAGTLYWTSTQVNTPIYNSGTGQNVYGQNAIALRLYPQQDIFGYIGEISYSKDNYANVRPVRRY
jgi:hypothetical protein